MNQRGTRPPQPSLERAALNERVKQQFERFGTGAGDLDALPMQHGPSERDILADDFRRSTLRIIGGVFLLSLFAYIGSTPGFDAPGVWANRFRFDTALFVVWGPMLAFLVTRMNLHRAVRTYLVLALFIEPFSETMMRQQGDGYWDSVLWPAAVAYFGTIKEWSGLPGASLPMFFVVTVLLLMRAIKTQHQREPVPKFARNALLVFLFSVIGMSAFGIAHGGTVEAVVRQVLHLVQLPLIALLFLHVLRIPEDLGAIGSIFVITALCRAALVAYVYFGVCVPAGIADRPGLPEWCTTHSDSVLFVISILIVVTHAFEQRTPRAIQRAVIVSSILLLAIVLNNRRLAFVSLAVAPAAIYLALKPSKRKTRMTTALVIGIPLALGYVLVGGEINSASPLLKPAKLVLSVLDQHDSSSISRDIENENLVYTMRQSPIVSTGFGFEYQSSPNNPPVDLSEVFVNFRLIAHNGVLWLWSIGGVVGFTLLWTIFPICGTLAMRGYRNAQNALERSAALTSLGTVGICIIQIWGDQGVNGYMVPVTFGVAFATATRLAMLG